MNEIEELEDILDAILAGVQEALANGEFLSEELQAQIAQEIILLTEEIDALYAQGEQAPEPITEVPPLSPAPHASSQIHSFKYDPDNQSLFIKYQDKYPGTNGPVYQYDGVPKFIFDVFRRGAVGPKTTGRNAWHAWKKGVTPSLGAAANALIKAGGYNYQRIQ